MNRYGSDYGESPPGRASAQACHDACQADGRCLSFTWVVPKAQAPTALCWLKSAIPNATPDQNTTSGWVRQKAVRNVPQPGGQGPSGSSFNSGSQGSSANSGLEYRIDIQRAIYGANCGSAVSATAYIAEACNNKPACDYKIDWHILSDPAVGCHKTLHIKWQCLLYDGPNLVMGNRYEGSVTDLMVPGEASGKTAHIACLQGYGR